MVNKVVYNYHVKLSGPQVDHQQRSN